MSWYLTALFVLFWRWNGVGGLCLRATTKKTSSTFFWEKNCIRVTWLEDFLTSKWTGYFTALAPPLVQRCRCGACYHTHLPTVTVEVVGWTAGRRRSSFATEIGHARGWEHDAWDRRDNVTTLNVVFTFWMWIKICIYYFTQEFVSNRYTYLLIYLLNTDLGHNSTLQWVENVV